MTDDKDRAPRNLDLCQCGHPRHAHTAYWNPSEPTVYGRGYCGATPGNTCICEGFVPAFALVPTCLDDYQVSTKATAVYPPEVEVSYLALGLANKAGEVAGVVKRCFRGDYGPNYLQAKDAMRAELGDALWYLARLAAVFDLKLSEVASANLAKLRDRKDRGVLKGKGDNR
jgi:NTP pyrophosphatase (non-canonical NTP hydrolase)